MIFRYIQCYIPTHVSNNIEFLYIHNYSQSWFESYWHAGAYQTIIVLSSCVPIIHLLECKSYGGIRFFYLILTAYWGESEHLRRNFRGWVTPERPQEAHLSILRMNSEQNCRFWFRSMILQSYKPTMKHLKPEQMYMWTSTQPFSFQAIRVMLPTSWRPTCCPNVHRR